jgi:hypothetical protein
MHLERVADTREERCEFRVVEIGGQGMRDSHVGLVASS